MVSSGRLETNSLKHATGHFQSPVWYAFGRKHLLCSFSSPWRVLLSLSVFHSKNSSPLASSFLKIMSPNFICLALCLARWPKWRVSKNHIVRERTSGSWMPNWFSSKISSMSSFDRASVAFGLLFLLFLVS